MLVTIAIIISLFFAMNIGASGAAASMGVAYGSGAISRPRNALILCAIFVFLGAIIGGGEVVKTISSGIIPTSLITIKIVVISLFSATISLFLANLLGIPQCSKFSWSTSKRSTTYCFKRYVYWRHFCLSWSSFLGSSCP